MTARQAGSDAAMRTVAIDLYGANRVAAGRREFVPRVLAEE